MPPISRETAWYAGSKYSPISPADLPGRWITRGAPAIRSPSRTASSIAMGAYSPTCDPRRRQGERRSASETTTPSRTWSRLVRTLIVLIGFITSKLGHSSSPSAGGSTSVVHPATLIA